MVVPYDRYQDLIHAANSNQKSTFPVNSHLTYPSLSQISSELQHLKGSPPSGDDSIHSENQKKDKRVSQLGKGQKVTVQGDRKKNKLIPPPPGKAIHKKKKTMSSNPYSRLLQCWEALAD